MLIVQEEKFLKMQIIKKEGILKRHNKMKKHFKWLVRKMALPLEVEPMPLDIKILI